MKLYVYTIVVIDNTIVNVDGLLGMIWNFFLFLLEHTDSKMLKASLKDVLEVVIGDASRLAFNSQDFSIEFGIFHQ